MATNPPMASKSEPDTRLVWEAFREAHKGAFGLDYPPKPDAADNKAIKTLTIAVGFIEAIRLVRLIHTIPHLGGKYRKARFFGDAHGLRVEIANQAKRAGLSQTQPQATPKPRAPDPEPKGMTAEERRAARMAAEPLMAQIRQPGAA